MGVWSLMPDLQPTSNALATGAASFDAAFVPRVPIVVVVVVVVAAADALDN